MSFEPAEPRVAIASASSDPLPEASSYGIKKTFPPASRLRRPAEFSAVFRARKVLRGNWFNVHVLSRAAATSVGSGARLGLIVPKKILRSAVARNITKRLVREAFREQRKALPDSDFIFRLTTRPGPSARKVDRKAIRTEVARLIRRCSVGKG